MSEQEHQDLGLGGRPPFAPLARAAAAFADDLTSPPLRPSATAAGSLRGIVAPAIMQPIARDIVLAGLAPAVDDFRVDLRSDGRGTIILIDGTPGMPLPAQIDLDIRVEFIGVIGLCHAPKYRRTAWVCQGLVNPPGPPAAPEGRTQRADPGRHCDRCGQRWETHPRNGQCSS